MRVVAAVATAALYLSAAAFGQQAAPPPRPTASPGKPPLDTVTVAAPRERKDVEREVNEFVAVEHARLSAGGRTAQGAG